MCTEARKVVVNKSGGKVDEAKDRGQQYALGSKLSTVKKKREAGRRQSTAGRASPW